jgi:hypothetical protein
VAARRPLPHGARLPLLRPARRRGVELLILEGLAHHQVFGRLLDLDTVIFGKADRGRVLNPVHQADFVHVDDDLFAGGQSRFFELSHKTGLLISRGRVYRQGSACRHRKNPGAYGVPGISRIAWKGQRRRAAGFQLVQATRRDDGLSLRAAQERGR